MLPAALFLWRDGGPPGSTQEHGAALGALCVNTWFLFPFLSYVDTFGDALFSYG